MQYDIKEIVQNLNENVISQLGFDPNSKTELGEMVVNFEDNLIEFAPNYFKSDEDLFFKFKGENYNRIYVFFNTVVFVNTIEGVSFAEQEADFGFEHITITGSNTQNCCDCHGDGLTGCPVFDWYGSCDVEIELCDSCDGTGEVELNF